MVRKLLVLAIAGGAAFAVVRKRRKDDTDLWHDATAGVDLR